MGAAGTGATVTLQRDTNTAAGTEAMTNSIVASSLGTTAGTNFAYLKETKISVQTSDYFAVGSTIEVMGTTWDDGGVDIAVGIAESVGTQLNPSSNKYRKFKVTGHVTNEFNREFAKLDSFPADDGYKTTSANEDKPDYLLKITSNNGTVHTYPGINAKVTVEEIQVINLGDGQYQTNTDQVWKLYYKGEETQNMDHASTVAQVAEEINGFSALSGAVTVTGEGDPSTATGFPRYVVTFDSKDGDVAEMTAVATTGAVTVTTRANGWSIEAPLEFGLDTMQAGGIINITAQEVCSFAFSSSLTAGQFCYAGICGTAVADSGAESDDFQDAVRSIKDDTGTAILLTATSTGKDDTSPIAVTLPLGMSCDHLELRLANVAVTKSVEKNNNGKQFKITRSFLQKTAFASVATTTTVQCANSLCHGAVAGVDSVVFGGSGCDAKTVAETKYPFARTSNSVTLSTNAAGNATIGFATAVANVDGSSCQTRYIARHVITLDSMPTASAAATQKNVLYTSPVGRCSVTETTKGTYESFECSNRGACDGKSGLCSCYEGYSGESCQTQTVLV